MNYNSEETLRNINIKEARWLFSNGIYIRMEDESTAIIAQVNYELAKQLRRWWKQKLEDEDEKKNKKFKI